MLVQLHNFGSGSSGIGALGVDGKAFIIQLITFVLAFLVLKKWAFGPIIKLLHERRATIEQGVKLGEQMKQEQAELEAKVEKILHDTRSKADSIIADAQETARQTIRESEEKAKGKAEGIISSAEDRIVQETASARQKLEQELVGLVADATEAVIHEKVDAKKDAQIIERALKGQRA